MRAWGVALLVGACLLGGGAAVAAAPFAEQPALALPGPLPRSVVVIGDFGSRSAAERDVADLVGHLAPQAIVTTGDNIYSASTYAVSVGAYYCAWIAGAPSTVSCPKSQMAASSSFFPATGNHDYSDGGIANYLDYFRTPRGRTAYSVTRGGIEFIIVDSQAALDSRSSMSRQLAWARARARASKARWQVVVLHHPPYSSGSVHGSTPQFQWPFAAWGVDLVLTGHDHDYERIVRGGVTYVVDGSGGANLYPMGTPLAGSAVRNDSDYGALSLTALPGGLQGSFWSTSGRLVDRFLLPG
jgi:hypothetical protein